MENGFGFEFSFKSKVILMARLCNSGLSNALKLKHILPCFIVDCPICKKPQEDIRHALRKMSNNDHFMDGIQYGHLIQGLQKVTITLLSGI